MGLIASILQDQYQRSAELEQRQKQGVALAELNKTWGSLTPDQRVSSVSMIDPKMGLEMRMKYDDPDYQAKVKSQTAIEQLAALEGGGRTASSALGATQVAPAPQQGGDVWNEIMSSMPQQEAPQPSALAQLGSSFGGAAPPPMGALPPPPEYQPMDTSENDVAAQRRRLAIQADPKSYLQRLNDSLDPVKQAELKKKEQELKDKGVKADAAQAAQKLKYESAVQEFDSVLGPEGHPEQSVIMKAAGQADPLTTSLYGWMGRNIMIAPNNANATNLDVNLDTIKSNAGLKALMEMKSSSPTGASGFGALSAPELNLLVSKIKSLDPKMGDRQLRDNLHSVFTEMDKMRSRLKATGPAGMTQLEQDAADAISQGADPEAVKAQMQQMMGAQ